MASKAIELFRGLTAELKVLLNPVPVTRRYMPYVDGRDLQQLRVSIYVESIERQEIVRDTVDIERVTFGIAVQQSVALQTSDVDVNGDAVMDGVDNLAHGDAVLDQVEKIKDFWRANGPLRHKPIAQFSYLDFVHDPPYEPIHLATIGVFTSIIDVTYQLSQG